MIVVHILVGRLSGKRKDDLSTLRKFLEVDLFTPACYSNHAHYLIFSIAMTDIEDETSYSNRYSGCRS